MAGSARAQGLGLDLTQEPTDQPGKGTAAPRTPTEPELEVAKPGAEPILTAPTTAREPPLDEGQITQDDRVKSIQRKVYLRKNRFEVTPMIAISVNDPLYVKWGGVLRVAYYLTDTLALTLRGTYLDVVPTDDVRRAKSTFQSRIFFSNPDWGALAGVEWSPIYGKFSIFNSIIHFDGYVLAGLGVINTETSSLPGRGPNPAMDLGLGLRFQIFDWFAVTAALMNTTYVDQPAGTSKASTQNLMTINAGLSIFIPFRSTGRDAE
ncbi:MAG: outer membrane beta-barrel domain-containing protein [Myxococcaceae bacterium]